MMTPTEGHVIVHKLKDDRRRGGIIDVDEKEVGGVVAKIVAFHPSFPIIAAPGDLVYLSRHVGVTFDSDTPGGDNTELMIIKATDILAHAKHNQEDSQ